MLSDEWFVRYIPLEKLPRNSVKNCRKFHEHDGCTNEQTNRKAKTIYPYKCRGYNKLCQWKATGHVVNLLNLMNKYNIENNKSTAYNNIQLISSNKRPDKTTNLYLTDIRFNHGFEVLNDCCGKRLILIPNEKWRALISTEGRNTENPCFSPFICLFLTIILIISPSFTSLSGFLLFYRINC